MKCPHCKYVSFEYLDTCRKCSKDLKAHKSQHGIDYIAPISLGILTFVDTGSAPAGGLVSDEMSFDTADVVIDDDDSPEQQEVAVDFGADVSDEEAQFSVDESAGEEEPAGVMVEEETGEIEIAMEEAVEVADEEPVFEVGGMEDSDTGFSLGLGDDIEGDGEGLDFGSMDSDSGGSDSEAGEEIALDLDDSGAGGEEISLAIDEQEPSSDLEMNILAEKETDASEEAVLKEEDDDFSDIELSLDDEELFGEDGGGSDDNLDLSGLDLELNDD